LDDDLTIRVIETIWETTAISIDRAQATPDMSLRDDLGLRSMDAVAIAFALEKEFGILIDTSALVGIRTIGDAVSLVRRQLPHQQSGSLS
jgi:acyl carrier protein